MTTTSAAQLLNSISPNASVLLYPSSCKYHEEFQAAPFDVVILNSHGFKHCTRRGKVYCLNLDNNNLLGLLHARGVSIASLVIIRDGCSEGGNYECVVGLGFFGRLMPLLSEPLVYSCDHLDHVLDAPIQFQPIKTPGYVTPFEARSRPLGPMCSFQIAVGSVVEKDLVLGRVRVKVIRDSLWRNVTRDDLVVLREYRSQHRANEEYLAGRFPHLDLQTRFEHVPELPTETIKRFLELACERKLSRVLLMPIAGGCYRKIVDEIAKWDAEYPQEVRFYHLKAKDYAFLRSL